MDAVLQEYRAQCHCGGVQILARGAPQFAANCHCSDCRGSNCVPAVPWVGFEEALVDLSGELKIYRSSEDAARAFCAHCGTPIYYRSDRWPESLHFLVELFADAAALKPGHEVYLKDRVSWAPFIKGARFFHTIPSDGQPPLTEEEARGRATGPQHLPADLAGRRVQARVIFSTPAVGHLPHS